MSIPAINICATTCNVSGRGGRTRTLACRNQNPVPLPTWRLPYTGRQFSLPAIQPSLEAQPRKGCASKVLHVLIRQASGAPSRSTPSSNCANTALPEPVIRPGSPEAPSQSRARATSGQCFVATGCKSLQPKANGSAAKPEIVAGFESRFSSGLEKIAEVSTPSTGFTTTNRVAGI